MPPLPDAPITHIAYDSGEIKWGGWSTIGYAESFRWLVYCRPQGPRSTIAQPSRTASSSAASGERAGVHSYASNGRSGATSSAFLLRSVRGPSPSCLRTTDPMTGHYPIRSNEVFKGRVFAILSPSLQVRRILMELLPVHDCSAIGMQDLPRHVKGFVGCQE